MMRKNNNNRNKHRGGQGGGRRYNGGGGGGGNRANDGQNIQRQKHHATQQLGKYNDLARNAQINGDRVDVEYYLQHVDHYTRVLTDIAAIEAERFAHQREQQQAQGGADAAPQEGQNDAAESAPEAGDAPAANESAEQSQPRQPRRERAPRRERSDNGAAEANSNTSEIPLPGSILPPV